MIKCLLLTVEDFTQTKWYHIAVTWSSVTGVCVYIDGTLYHESTLLLVAVTSITNDGVLVLGQVGDCLTDTAPV